MERKVQIKKQQEERKRSRSRDNDQLMNDLTDEADFELLPESTDSHKLLLINRGKVFLFIFLKIDVQSLRFQGAVQFQVYHGTVSYFGTVFNADNQWHGIISDPRKNMLLDIKNLSDDDSIKNLEVQLDNATRITIPSIPKKCSLIGLKEYKEYSEAEQQYLVQNDDEIKLRNFSTNYNKKKGFFSFNLSWRDNIDLLVKGITKNHIFLVNGVMNSGKSTFTSVLINQILSRTNADVYVMDIDPGQPNYTLAGQLTLCKISERILTNADFNDVEIISAYYLNTPTPNLNMRYYNTCVSQLLEDYKHLESESKKILLVNTCGWVEGLGAEIQMKVVETLQPEAIITLTKYDQGLKGNEFSQQCRNKHGHMRYLDVENDQYEGVMNVKGAVQRNRKIVNALSQSPSDKYLFNTNQVEGSNKLPLKFQDKTIKRDDFSISFSQALKIHTKPYHTIPFKQTAFCLIREQLNEVNNKIDTLRFFNCEVIAALKIDNAQFKSLRNFDDLRIIEIPFTKQQLPPIKILFYGLVRDIDYQNGVKIIPQNDLDITNMDFNAICLAHNSIFKFPSSYLMQDDVQELLIKNEVEQQQSGRRVVYSKEQMEHNVKHFMSDLHKDKK